MRQLFCLALIALAGCSASQTAVNVSNSKASAMSTLLLGEKARAYTYLTCQYVCQDEQGCHCDCNGKNYEIQSGYVCE